MADGSKEGDSENGLTQKEYKRLKEFKDRYTLESLQSQGFTEEQAKRFIDMRREKWVAQRKTPETVQPQIPKQGQVQVSPEVVSVEQTPTYASNSFRNRLMEGVQDFFAGPTTPKKDFARRMFMTLLISSPIIKATAESNNPAVWAAAATVGGFAVGCNLFWTRVTTRSHSQPKSA